MSFFALLLHHPRRLWLRRAFFQIHLWAGVLLALYLLVISLTGSILVFRSELTRAQLPPSLSRYDPSRVASIEQVTNRFRAEFPAGTLDDLQMPFPQMPAFVLTATDARHHPLKLLADPATGTLIRQPRTWLDWVYDLHVYLLLGHAYGMQVNGVGAAGLLLLTLTGLFLWWPGLKLWARGFGVSFRHNWRRINFDAHNAIGFWTLLLVSWWAFSGIYFAWYKPVTAAVAAVSPLRGMRVPKLSGPAPAGPDRVSLGQILGAVHQASPEGRLFSLSDPALTGSSVYALVDRSAPGDFSHRDIITLSTTDARTLSIWHYGENHSAGDWILWAMHPLHFGSLWGLACKVLWALAGCALALLTVTGVLIYWNRFLRHKLPG